MRKNLKLKRGFTIIELLAVVAILVIISGIVFGIIYSTLRGTAKTKVTTDVSQNGQYATTIINQIIQDSRNITQINGASLDDCTSSPNPTTDNITPIPAVIGPPSITLKRIDGGTTVLSCGTINNVYTIASNGASLVDNNVVKVASCVFSCKQLSQDPYSIPIVNVSFTLSQVNASIATESRASSIFNISNSLREYSP